jgi:hypothetical protein
MLNREVERREQGTGNREQGTGNSEQGTGEKLPSLFFLLFILSSLSSPELLNS